MTSYAFSHPRLVGFITLSFIFSIVAHCALKDPPKGVMWAILVGLYGLFLLSHLEKVKS